MNVTTFLNIFLVINFFLCITELRAQRTASFPAELYQELQEKHPAEKYLTSLHPTAAPIGDLIVGYPNPNEVREINTPLTIAGNIIVLNNGQLRFNNVETKLQGNIILLNNGKMSVTGGMFTVNQIYLYQYRALLTSKSSLQFRGANVRFSGFNFGCGISDTAVLDIENTSFAQGIMTSTLLNHGSVRSVGCQAVGELLFFDYTKGSFENTDGFLTWIVAPPQCDLDLTLPGKSINGMYALPDSARKAVGMNARITYATCFNTLWGLITTTGSKVRVTNSNLLACGALFNGTGKVSVENLVNKAHLESFQYPAADRDVRFVNSNVTTWNLYPSANVDLTVQSSIFGEIIGMNKSNTTVANSICDGTGGYAGTMDSSRMMFVSSQVTSEVNARNNSFFLLLLTNITSGAMHVTDNAIMALLNSNFSALPFVEENCAALIGSIDEPTHGFVGQKLKIYGTSRVIAGASFPFSLATSWLEFASTAEPDLFTRITPPSLRDRYRDTLGTWDTKGLLAGEYILRLNMRINTGTNLTDTIRVDRLVRLLNAPLSVRDAVHANDLTLDQNYPNPFSDRTMIRFRVSENHTMPRTDNEITLRVHDAFGREVHHSQHALLLMKENEIEFDAQHLAPGLYGYSVIMGKTISTGRMIVRR